MALVTALAVPAMMLAGCGEWHTLTSGSIDIESAERDTNGYITEEEAKQGALEHTQILDEALCDDIVVKLDDSGDPVKWVVYIDSEGESYHYEVDAKTGELISFGSIRL